MRFEPDFVENIEMFSGSPLKIGTAKATESLISYSFGDIPGTI
jgi:hypothetical protein